MDTDRRKKPAHWIALIVFTYILVELCSLGGLWFLKKTRNIHFSPADTLSSEHKAILSRLIHHGGEYTIFSPTLGWAIQPDSDKDGFRANSDGLRSDKNYTRRKPEGTFRILTFGDSFTHCNDVANEQAWQPAMEELSPKLEVLNFGVGGYGLDQAYLRYKELGSLYEADVVLIGYMPENIFRHVNVYRPFYVAETGAPLAKPRFILKDGELELLPVPFSTMADYQALIDSPKTTLREVGINDYHFRSHYESSALDWSPAARIVRLVSHKAGGQTLPPILRNRVYNENSDAYAITLKLFDAFYAEVKSNGAIPIIVITPNQNDLRRYQIDKDKMYAPLLKSFTEKGYRVIDLTELLDDQDAETVFIPHYSPECNKVIAERLYGTLGKMLTLPNWPAD